jgi:cardiolipin synthase A/B
MWVMLADLDLWSWFQKGWQIALAVLALALSIVASVHAVLWKRDPRAAIAWMALAWLVPLAGPVLYFVFGVNRLRRQAALLRGRLERFQIPAKSPCVPEELHRHLPGHTGHLFTLARVVGAVVRRPLLAGNEVECLVNGDEAYPAMLEAIRQARKSVSFLIYIFDRDEIGVAFARELGAASRRGVAVRVLIDAAGTRYSFPSVLHTLKHEGINYARFLPVFPLWRILAMNLRTHRKIMVVDGRIGFTGSINIRAGHCLELKSRSPVQDIHFRVTGPVVAQLQEAFTDDWLFTTKEALRGPDWFPPLEPAGPVLARGIPDGPDEDFEKLRWTLLGALAAARHSILIVTPYFLPDQTLIFALNLAAMRGVQVDILLPSRNNLPFMHWASRAMWWQVLEHGCRIWLTPPPFDHSKLMIVDGCWVLLGSANWDPRSLRLNFEFNLECYDAALAGRLEQLVDKKKSVAHLVTLNEVDQRGFPVRLLDGVARLMMPYL